MTKTTYIIDFDSTLVTTESLDDLAEIALRSATNRESLIEEIHTITDLAMDGHITFQESLSRRLKLFSPTQEMIDELTSNLKHQVSPSALLRKDWFEENRDYIYVISGGFEDYIIPIVEILGISPSRVYANKFIFKDGLFVGHDESRLTSKAGGKAQQVKNLQIDGKIVIIGDGYTDYEIKKDGVADEFWAYTETINRDTVTQYADRVVDSFREV